MIKDDRGQVALEYLLIFALSLILLVVFTLPLTEKSVENTLDISDSLDVKSDLSKIAQAVKQVYGEGQGSRHSVNVISKSNLKVNIADNYVSTSLKLKDGSNKHLKVNFKSNLDESSLQLKKGENVIIVEWPVGSENMVLYRK